MRKMLMMLLLTFLLIPTVYTETSLLDEAAGLARQIDQLAGSADYTAAYTSDPAVQRLASSWAAGDHDAPALTVHIRAELPSNYADLDMPDVHSMLANALCSRHGVTATMAGSILHGERVFASDAVGSGLMLLLYEDAAPVLVPWEGRDGAVYMSARFMMDDEALRQAKTAKDIEGYLADLGVPVSIEILKDEVPCERAASPRFDVMERAVAAAARMTENAADQKLLEVLGASPHIIDIAAQWSGPGEPDAAYALTLPQEGWDASLSVRIAGYHGTKTISAVRVCF